MTRFVPVTVVTPPAAFVDLDLAKKHLRVDYDDDDDLIELQIAAAQASIDGPAGWLGRAVGPQVLRAEFDQAWGAYSALDLPCPPVVAVQTVEDVSGAEPVEIDPSAWTHHPFGVRARSMCTLRRFRVTYQAGYVAQDGETPAVPPPFRQAILLMVGDLYENRQAQVIDARAVVAANPTVEALLAPYRVWSC